MPVNDGGPAFPRVPSYVSDNSPGSPYDVSEPGMSLRDWFAGMAMVGLSLKTGFSSTTRDAASTAYMFADAMIAQREYGR